MESGAALRAPDLAFSAVLLSLYMDFAMGDYNTCLTTYSTVNQG
jgi:hypothetical protein